MKTVITGYGLFMPGFREVKALFGALYQNHSLLKHATLTKDASPVKVVCSQLEKEDFESLNQYRDLSIPLHITTKMALYAAQKALKAAGLRDIKNIKAGLFCACNKAIPNTNFFTDLCLDKNSLKEKNLYQLQQEMATINPAQAAQHLSMSMGIAGPVITFSDACTASASALLSAQRRIASGELDIAICGATEQAAHPLMQLSFNRLGALSTSIYDDPTNVCRPFDRDRSGCLLADAAAFIILESEAHAKKRQVPILANLVGGHRQSEAFKITSTDKSGSFYKQTMQRALMNTQLRASDIQHINAHGTSTPANDAAESRAIEQLFMCKTSPLFSVTSTKSALGHSLATSGMIEAILSVESLLQQKVLPTLNFTAPHDDEPLLPIVTKGMTQELRHVMSNSFGFGGENASVIFSRRGL